MKKKVMAVIIAILLLCGFTACSNVESNNNKSEVIEPYTESQTLTKKQESMVEDIDKWIRDCLTKEYDLIYYGKMDENQKFPKWDIMNEKISKLIKEVNKLSQYQYEMVYNNLYSEEERKYLQSVRNKDFQNRIRLRRNKNEIVKVRDSEGKGEVIVYIEYTETGIKLQAYRYSEGIVEKLKIKCSSFGNVKWSDKFNNRIYGVDKTAKKDCFFIADIEDAPLLIILSDKDSRKDNVGLSEEINKKIHNYQANYESSVNQNSQQGYRNKEINIQIQNHFQYYHGNIYQDVYKTGLKKCTVEEKVRIAAYGYFDEAGHYMGTVPIDELGSLRITVYGKNLMLLLETEEGSKTEEDENVGWIDADAWPNN